MKRLKVLLIMMIISVSTCFSAFAGEWKQDNAGWWYDNGNGSYAKEGWNWIEGNCFYFTADGYCLINTTTPDGYQVNESGAWVIDGVVQTPGNGQSSVLNPLQFTAPSDYYLADKRDFFTMYIRTDMNAVIGLYDFDLEQEISQLGENAAAYSDMILDHAIGNNMGKYVSKSYRQLASGTWNCYDYNDNFLDIPGTMTVYARFVGGSCHVVFFVGDISGMDMDAAMNAGVK